MQTGWLWWTSWTTCAFKPAGGLPSHPGGHRKAEEQKLLRNHVQWQDGSDYFERIVPSTVRAYVRHCLGFEYIAASIILRIT